MSSLESLLRTIAMLLMICIGLTVVCWTFFWPILLLVLDYSFRLSLLESLFLGGIHILLLIYVEYPYLYLHRLVFLPIRMLLMPLVNKIFESDAIQEQATVWYNDCEIFGQDGDEDTTITLPSLLSTFKSSIRRDIKRKLRLYKQNRITTTTIHSNHLSLRHDIPIIWKHQQRQCRCQTDCDNKSTLEEFLKRFLVIFLVSNAYIDRYYYTPKPNGNGKGQLCAIGMFVTSHKVFIQNMYFSTIPFAGIWQYHHIRGLYRAVSAYNKHGENIQYINYFHHQDMAKRLAGAQPLQLVNNNSNTPETLRLRQQLFPLAFYKEPPRHAINIQLDLSTIDSNKNDTYNKKQKRS